MEDEEAFFSAIREPLYRVEAGNLEYRHAVRLRQMARTNFASLRYDVQVRDGHTDRHTVRQKKDMQSGSDKLLGPTFSVSDPTCN